MTADDIIAANPDLGFARSKVGSYDGLIGVDPDTRQQIAVLYCGGFHVDFPWPMRPEGIEAAWANLSRAVTNATGFGEASGRA